MDSEAKVGYAASQDACSSAPIIRARSESWIRSAMQSRRSAEMMTSVYSVQKTHRGRQD